MKTSMFKVKGMHCRSCEMLLEESIEEIGGVEDVKASHQDENVTVRYDETKTDDAHIIDAISKEGYKVD